MRKTLVLAAGLITAVGSLLGPGALSAAAATTVPHPSSGLAAPAGQSRPGTLTTHYRTVPLSSIPTAARAAVASTRRGPAARPNSSITIVELINVQYGMCVDANNYGPGAGLDGDSVQLYGCFYDPDNHANQWWIPVDTTQGYTELVSLQYGSKCLDADNSRGFIDGAKLQLWDCFDDSVNHANQWWNYGPPNAVGPLQLLWGGGTKVLDANNYGPTAGQNGDKIQLWRYLATDNQRWYQ